MLDTLNQWNEEIKHSNPSFDTISIGDLLEDINDEEVFEEQLILDNGTNNNSTIQFTDSNQMTIPWSFVNSLQDLYGGITNDIFFS